MRNQGGGRGGGGGGGNFNQGKWGDGGGGNQNSGGNWGNQSQGRSPKQGGGNQNQMDDGDDDGDGDSVEDGPQKRKHRGGQKVKMRRFQQQEQQRQDKQQNRGNKQGGGGGGQGGNPNKRPRMDNQGDGNQGGNRKPWGKPQGRPNQRGGGQGEGQGGKPQNSNQSDQWGEGSPADMENIQNKLTKIAERIAKKLSIANSDEDKLDYFEEFIKDAADIRGESLFKFEMILNKLGLMSSLVFMRDMNNSSVCRFYINDIYVAQGFGLNQTKSKTNAYTMSDDLFKERNWRSKLVCDQKLRQDSFLKDDIDITFINYPEEHKTIETTQFNCSEQVTLEWTSIVLLEKTGVFQGSNGILKQSAEFNKMVLEYDYVEPEKSVCK
jgi:hypothetical protein